MTTQKTTIKLPTSDGSTVDVEGVEIPISKTQEQWSEIELEDGSTIRLKPTIIKVIKIEGQFDQEGNPMYVAQSAQLMVVNSPKGLRKR